MKVISLSALVVLLLCTPVDGQTPSISGERGRTAAEQEVRAAEELMHKAYVAGDAKAFRGLYTDDSTFTYSSGSTVGPDERAKSVRAFPDLKDEIVSIKVLGDLALVRCISEYSNTKGTAKDRITVLRVWQKRGGKWQVVAFQATPAGPSA